MAKLVQIPLPDPDDDAEDFAQVPVEDDDPSRPRRNRRERRRGRRAAKSKRRNPLSTNYNIPVATPQNIDRANPAGDTDEEGTRSKWWRTEDTHHAEIAKLQMQNAAKNLTDPLSARVAAERLLIRELRLRRQATRVARQARDQLQTQLHDADGSDGGSKGRRRAIRHHLAKASGVATELERREIEIEHKLCLVTHRIDITPDLVQEEVAIVLGHFWREYEERWLARAHEVGMWRDDEELRYWAQRSFDEYVGAPVIPTAEEIRERIRVLRAGASRFNEDGTDVDLPSTTDDGEGDPS